jgi:hypothetical protein
LIEILSRLDPPLDQAAQGEDLSNERNFPAVHRCCYTTCEKEPTKLILWIDHYGDPEEVIDWYFASGCDEHPPVKHLKTSDLEEYHDLSKHLPVLQTMIG